MTGKKLVPALILCLLATSLCVVGSAYASYPDYYVNVLVAWDEEFEVTSHWKYGYAPQTFAELMLWAVACRFGEAFGIKFEAVAFTSWDSYDDPISDEEMFREAVDEIGFESGMGWNGRTIDLLVAFTDQTIPCDYGVIYGLANQTAGVVLVEETYTYAAGQHTDNVLQHECSHLYGAEDHAKADFDCVMNCYEEPIGLPELMNVPQALLTENWCQECKEIIAENRALWGRTSTGGGGGSGGGGGGGTNPLITPDEASEQSE